MSLTRGVYKRASKYWKWICRNQGPRWETGSEVLYTIHRTSREAHAALHLHSRPWSAEQVSLVWAWQCFAGNGVPAEGSEMAVGWPLFQPHPLWRTAATVWWGGQARLPRAMTSHQIPATTCTLSAYFMRMPLLSQHL